MSSTQHGNYGYYHHYFDVNNHYFTTPDGQVQYPRTYVSPYNNEIVFQDLLRRAFTNDPAPSDIVVPRTPGRAPRHSTSDSLCTSPYNNEITFDDSGREAVVRNLATGEVVAPRTQNVGSSLLPLLPQVSSGGSTQSQQMQMLMPDLEALHFRFRLLVFIIYLGLEYHWHQLALNLIADRDVGYESGRTEPHWWGIVTRVLLVGSVCVWTAIKERKIVRGIMRERMGLEDADEEGERAERQGGSTQRGE